MRRRRRKAGDAGEGRSREYRSGEEMGIQGAAESRGCGAEEERRCRSGEKPGIRGPDLEYRKKPEKKPEIVIELKDIDVELRKTAC